eukprot:5389672-Prymnesium_polylepis.3
MGLGPLMSRLQLAGEMVRARGLPAARRAEMRAIRRASSGRVSPRATHTASDPSAASCEAL